MSTSVEEPAARAPAFPDLSASPFVDPLGEEPIRAELFGLDYLEAHAKQLAAASVLATRPPTGTPPLRRFAENGRVLQKAHREILEHLAQGRGQSIDAEWLADNFHIVEDTLHEIKVDLPGGYYAELPKLVGGPLDGYPRVFALGLGLIAHSDSALDESRIIRYVQAFQSVTPLTIGELWAVPTMLRLALIENLRRLAAQMLKAWDEHRQAEAWAAKHLPAGDGKAEGEPKATPSAEFPTLADPFVVRLIQLVRDLGQKSLSFIAELEARLVERGLEANELLRREHHRQAASQVSVGNCVTSLRLLSALDWNVFFEQNSLVEVALRDDPAQVYARQDFATRDRYRRAVEKIARGAEAEESDVARRAVALAAGADDEGGPRGHVGYYLIDRGRDALKRALGYRAAWRERIYDFVVANPRTVYFGALVALIVAIVAALVVLAGAIGGAPIAAWQWALLVAAVLLPASELAVGIVNHAVVMMITPRVLPKLDFKTGITPDCATFVVMPSMLVRPESAAVLVARLETHYLANPDPHLRFALLTDFADAPAAEMPEDEKYVRAALDGIKALNERYASGGPDKFFIFHRRRLWNPVQGCWMGWERKRGKLSEFNQLIRGAHETSYAVLSGDPGQLPTMRYVITLDADTQLTRDTAQRLIGTLAHPLNRARFDPSVGRVVEGYGVLQPRISYHLLAATRSRFAAILGASGGIDPYATAVSDTYMDLFGAGSFTGKGIYDIEAFEGATGKTFPENQILSHDLIEGNFARCGLVTDIEMFDDFPARYHAFARREHRWVRGDWQLLPWLGRTVPTADKPRPNTLAAPERWKVFDNLRRSLVPPALVALLALGWTVLPGAPWLWTATALAVVALPLLQQVVVAIIGALRRRTVSGLVLLREDVPATGKQVLLSLAFLADQARLLTDAIVRTLYRLLITRRYLLEWETAASAERRLGIGLSDFVVNMWPASVIAVALTAVVAAARPSALVAAGPILLLWLLSPVVAWWVSRPLPAAALPLTEDERNALRRIARRTWHFFETFVGDDDHWLPPDNVQFPEARVAHRTSPTNKGLLLLSTLSAHDLGYLGLRTLLTRLEKTFDTFDRLEKHRGHIYNWYDTRTLSPLPPAYISTVDSGNLLGCLVALKQGLREKAKEPVLGSRIAKGLADTLGIVADVARAIKRPGRPGPDEYQALEGDFRATGRLLEEAPADLLAWDDWLGRADWAAVGLVGKVRALASVVDDVPEGLEPWARRLTAQIREHRAELAAVVPWLAPLRAADEVAARPSKAPDEFDRRWSALRSELIAVSNVAEIAARTDARLAELDALGALLQGAAGQDRLAGKLREVAAAVRESAAGPLHTRCHRLARRAEVLGAEMDFQFLYKPDRHLFSIGCNLMQGRLDGACYDLLASESALTSYLTVARGEVPRQHWFQLGRPYIRVAGRTGLMSWGGTMFEYLMPRLLMRSLDGTVLAEACQVAVARQMEYGRQHGVPWGISESAFAAVSIDGDYHYQAFGVPGLGLKRGLARDMVVAPYATAMAVIVRPREALENFRSLAKEGAEGAYGFYEAVDFTPERVPKGRRSVVVTEYMAHHQGMSLVALANAALDEPMVRRFQAEPMVRAADLLLQERVPRIIPLVEPSEEELSPAEGGAREGAKLMARRLTTPTTPVPRTHLLSNNQYSVMLTNAGSGYSTCRSLDVTRWREDSTRDCWGQFVYVRDLGNGVLWSAGHQPTCRAADEYEVLFSADKAAIRRLDEGIETLLEVAVSPETLAEVRRVTLTNRDTTARELELTSYAEIVLSARAADLAHPAFGKLFLETEWVSSSEALLCRRRPRWPEQPTVWAMHVAASDQPHGDDPEYETDRARFVGRGRSAAHPAALDPNAVLSRTTGAVLDPIFSLRRRVRIEPGASAVVAFTTVFSDTQAEALALADQYREIGAVSRTFELAWAHCQVEQRHRNWSGEETHLYQRLGAHILYAGTALRAAPPVLIANRQGTVGLWRQGISGDMPIVLVRIVAIDEMPLARQMVTAHSYLRFRGLPFDLVLLNEQPTTYLDELNQHLMDLVRSGDAHDLQDKPGGIFVRKADHLPDEDRILLQAAARVVLVGDRGPLAGQLDRVERALPLPEPMATTRGRHEWHETAAAAPRDLLFANGLGGFTPDGREYVVTVLGDVRPDTRRNGRPGRPGVARPVLPPAPWINVVSNPGFGFLVSEAGSGYTWAGNSQSNRLTPWNNDPVADTPGEAVYLRDESTGEVWSPTPLPLASESPTVVRHGQGYTVFERESHGLKHELLLFVPADDPVKLIRLKVVNHSDRPRHLSATFYAEWVLGTVRDLAPMQVVTELDAESGALLAQNAFNADYAARVAFADVDLRPRSITAGRAEFLGRNGSTAAPAALGRVALSGRVGAAIDPCAAIQAKFDLAPGQEKEIVFLLGEAEGLDAARAILKRYREPGQVQAAFDEVTRRWDQMLTAVQVKTPDPALDLLLNRWLPYQVLSCRVWGRSAFYQSGGAYGFRDQLQDAMALVHGAPGEARAHLIRASGRQFVEGDVQHWWHPPTGRGVRTHFSDDYLWLPFVACQYVAATGDSGVLDERAPFLKAPLLNPEQEDEYGLPTTTEETGTLYDHCVRALEHGWRLGAHGLPLMGSGDWNDGMNKVGAGGKGESVWVAWFLLATLRRFARVAEARGDAACAALCLDRAEQLCAAVEEHAWDGDWYLRAFFDDGTPLGSSRNEECQIDSIAQSWAVISGAGDPARARRALAAVEARLVRSIDGLILLFTPPFDKGTLQPGYIKGYVPGIRENGGQYTHAAIWVVQATALLGQGKRAVELFDLLNPIHHASDPEGVARYKVEPYVVAADVYGRPPHTGRGGWTWYTGSAAWLYRVGLETILGFRTEGDRLVLSPCLPDDWPRVEIRYRHRSATYEIAVENPDGLAHGTWAATLDGHPADAEALALADDGRAHEVRLILRPAEG